MSDVAKIIGAMLFYPAALPPMRKDRAPAVVGICLVVSAFCIFLNVKVSHDPVNISWANRYRNLAGYRFDLLGRQARDKR
jgi:hypothetical protein